MENPGDRSFQHPEGSYPESCLRLLGQWDEATLAEMERQLNTPERRALAATLQNVARRGEPAYALAERDLSAGAVAVIVRDPGAEPSRLIVFGASSLSDEAVACARGALMQSEVAEPQIARRRVITLWLDGRYEVREGERRATGRREWRGPSSRTAVAERLRKAAALSPIVSIPEIGAVRMAVSVESLAEPERGA